MASLDERFDAHLAQAENLQALFVALNDQVFEIRELAICTVGRLSSMNPAFVMPFLRKMLIQVMGGQPHLVGVREGLTARATWGQTDEDKEGGGRDAWSKPHLAPRVRVFPAWQLRFRR